MHFLYDRVRTGMGVYTSEKDTLCRTVTIINYTKAKKCKDKACASEMHSKISKKVPDQEENDTRGQYTVEEAGRVAWRA